MGIFRKNKPPSLSLEYVHLHIAILLLEVWKRYLWSLQLTGMPGVLMYAEDF